MKKLMEALVPEFLKLKRSKFLLITLVLFVFIPFMMSILMFAAMHPDSTANAGLTGSKAGLMSIGEPNWESYFKLLLQSISGVGLVGIGFVTSWIFGSEFSPNTFKDLIALPVSRTKIVVSKFIVIVAWSVILTLVFYLSSLLFGKIIGLGDLESLSLGRFSASFFTTALLNMVLSAPVAFLACYSRGVMLSIGFVILSIILSNFASMLGVSGYFPWAIPGVNAMQPDQLTVASYVIVLLTGIVGFIGTVVFWRTADHK